jgi:uncharacterized membrane protein
MQQIDTLSSSFSLMTFVCIACLTIAILLLGYETHTQRTSLLTTARNGKHVLHMTDHFSRKASLTRYAKG